MQYQRKAHAVTAQQYDGSFDLDFLQADERVRVARPNGASIHIVGDDGDGYELVTEVALGEWVVRDCHGLNVLDAEDFVANYEPAEALTAGQTINRTCSQHHCALCEGGWPRLVNGCGVAYHPALTAGQEQER